MGQPLKPGLANKSQTSPDENSPSPATVSPQPSNSAAFHSLPPQDVASQMPDLVPPGNVIKRKAHLSAANSSGSSQNKSNAPTIAVVPQSQLLEPTSAETSLSSLEMVALVQSAQPASQPPQSKSILPVANAVNLNPPPPADDPPPPADDPPPPADDPPPPAHLQQPLGGVAPANASPAVVSVPPPMGVPSKPRPDDTEPSRASPQTKQFTEQKLQEAIDGVWPNRKALDAAGLNETFMTTLSTSHGDGVHLTVSKVEGDGYRVVNKKGIVLYLKVEESKGHHRFDQLNPRRRSQIKQAKRAIRALVEHSEVSGLVERANQNQEALRDGNKVAMKWVKELFGNSNISNEVSAHALELIKEQAAQDESRARLERAEKLHAQFEAAASAEPDLSVAALVAENWLPRGQDGQRQHILDEVKDHFKKKENEESIHLDADADSSAARRNDFVDKMLAVNQAGNEASMWLEMSGKEFYKRIEPWTRHVRGTSGEIQKPEVVLNTMMRFAIQTPALVMNIGDSVKRLVTLSAPTEPETKFKSSATLVGPQIVRYFDQLQEAVELFTDEQFLAEVPSNLRGKLVKLGQAMKELANAVLDPQGPFVAVYRLADAAVAEPAAVRADIYLATMPPPSELPPPLNPIAAEAAAS